MESSHIGSRSIWLIANGPQGFCFFLDCAQVLEYSFKFLLDWAWLELAEQNERNAAKHGKTALRQNFFIAIIP